MITCIILALTVLFMMPNSVFSMPRFSVEEKNGMLLRDGKPVFILGACTDPRWAGIEKFREFGLNAVHYDIFNTRIYHNWQSETPDWKIDVLEDEYWVKQIERLDWIAKNNLMWIPQLQIRFFPRWYTMEQKDGPRTLCADGKQGFFWTGEEAPHSASVHDPALREFLARNYKDLFREFHPLINAEIIAYSSTNEPGYGSGGSPADYSPESKLAFRTYLADKYGAVGNMNNDLGLSVSSFSEVEPPTDKNRDRALWYVWMRWNQRQWADFFGWLQEAIKAANENVKVIHKHPVFQLSSEHAAVANLPQLLHISQDIYGADFYPWSPGDARNKSEIASSLADRRPMINLETAPLWGLDGKRQPYSVDLTYLAQIIGGAKGLIHFQFDGTSHEHDLLNTKLYDEAAQARVKKLFRLISDHQDVFAAPKKPAGIACYLSEAAQIHGLGEDRYASMAWGAFDLVRNQGYEVDFISDEQMERGRLSRYKLLVIPSGSIVPGESIRKMEDFHSSGGNFLVFGRAFLRDMYYRPTDLPGFLGMKTRYIRPDNLLGYRSGIGDVRPVLQPYLEGSVPVFGPESIEVAPEAPTLPGQAKAAKTTLDMLAHSIALCSGGQVVYCGFESWYGSELSRLMGGIVEAVHGIPRDVSILTTEGFQDPAIMSTVLYYQDNRYVILMSESFRDKELKISFPERLRPGNELVTGKRANITKGEAPYTSSISLVMPARSYRVLKLKSL